MSHFDEHDWFEFSREKVTLERRETMQQHLDAGCEKCEKTAGHCRCARFLVAQAKISRDPLYFLRCSLPFME
jgi:hypothetical protein